MGWLARRATAVASLEVALLYPDAEALLGLLVPSLADGLRRLVLRGTCSDWPFFWVDWRWLAGMTQVRRRLGEESTKGGGRRGSSWRMSVG